MTRQFAAELCAFWKERYEAVVLDLPDVRTTADCGFAALADRLLLVTTSELAALQAARRGLQRDDVKTALNMEPYAALENDYEVLQAAVLEGRLAPSASRYGASVRSLCRQMTQKAAQTKKNESWLSGLLHRKPLMSR